MVVRNDNEKLEIHIKYGGEWLLAVSADNVKDGYLDVAIERLSDKIASHLRDIYRGKETDYEKANFNKKGEINI